MAKQINFGGALLKQFGAYIRTDLTGLVDINGVASGVIGIIGLAEKGPVNKAVTISGYTQLVETFGDGPLVRHGLAAYVGGASQLVCVRTGDPSGATLTAIEATGDISITKDYTFRALEKGTLGNNIFVSVEEQTQGTVDTEDDNYAIRIKYIDSRGNDIRETFVVPRYIPDKTGMYWPANPGNYYVLRDRENGVIREVPNTWAFGNLDEEAFLKKVEDLKSPTEDLLGPFPYGDGENPYPIALIASVINNGGLGQAPSSLISLTDLDPAVEDLLVEGYTYDPEEADELFAHPFVQLSGGHNGDDGTNFYGILDDVSGDMDYNITYTTPGVMGVWDESLGVMEDEEVNFIQPAYLFNYKKNSDGSLSTTFTWANRYGFFKALMPKFLAHVETMSNIANRKFRTMVVGLPYYKTGDTVNGTSQDFLDAVEDISGLINNDRVQLWAGGFQSRAFSSRLENYGADMLASFAVGAHASRTVSTSLTFAQLAGIFTDGLEFAFNHSQKDELYTRSLAFVMKRRNSVGAIEFVAAHNYTSFTGASSRGLQLFITRRIVDYMNTFVYKNLEENFIGRKSRGAETAAAISEFVGALLNRLVREDTLVAYRNVTAYADDNDKTIYYVEYDFQPVTEIDFIPVTNKLLYNLA